MPVRFQWANLKATCLEASRYFSNMKIYWNFFDIISVYKELKTSKSY